MKLQHERELECLRVLHANEVASLKAQASSSVFLRSLVSQVESGAANLESLSKKVYQERSASERLTFEQLQVRDKLLSEKEVSLEAERRQNEALLATFQRLQRDHDESVARLRDEHARLATLQQDLKTEGNLVKDQMTQERDQLRRERTLLQNQRDAWEVKFKREMGEVEMQKEMNERAHGERNKTRHGRGTARASCTAYPSMSFADERVYAYVLIVHVLVTQFKLWRASRRLSESARTC